MFCKIGQSLTDMLCGSISGFSAVSGIMGGLTAPHSRGPSISPRPSFIVGSTPEEGRILKC